MKEVAAVTSREESKLVEHLLRKHGGDLYADIWTFGVNTALRIGDLLSVKMVDVLNRDMLLVVEQKTGKVREITLNDTVKKMIARRVMKYPYDTWLFQVKGNRAKALEKPISRETVARKFAEVGEIMGVQIATHSMRKSRGAILYKNGVAIEQVCKILNHSSPSVTMKYIGLDRATIAKSYTDYEI